MLIATHRSMRITATTLLTLVALTTAALPGQTLTAVHHDFVYQNRSMKLARNTWQEITTFNFPRVLSVPRFDPALGELKSARLIIYGDLVSEMVSHALGPFFDDWLTQTRRAAQ